MIEIWRSYGNEYADDDYVFCVATLCDLLRGYQSLGETYCHHLQSQFLNDLNATFLRNVGTQVQEYMALRLRRLQSVEYESVNIACNVLFLLSYRGITCHLYFLPFRRVYNE